MELKYQVIRAIFASFVPVTIYSICHVFELTPKGMEYFDFFPWTTIVLFSLLYPTSQFFLYLIFEPLELLIKYKMKYPDTKKKSFSQRGNYRPVKNEISYQITKFEKGEVPEDISGVFLKNGPNSLYESKTGRVHWFEGDGMIHALRIKQGQLWYCNRFTKTNIYKQQKLAGKHVGLKLGELYGIGVFLAPLSEFLQNIAYKESFPKHTRGQANTAFVHHSKKTYALVEVDFPFHFKVDLYGKVLDINSVGYEDFVGQLKHHCSAHPKVDARTKELFIFAYDVTKPVLHYSVMNQYQRILSTIQVPITSPRMIHDFQITQNHVIFPDLPLEFNPAEAVKKNRFVFHYDDTKPCRYGIMIRYKTNAKEIKWFDVPAHYVFHFVNSWEEYDENADLNIVMFAVVWDNVNLDFQKFDNVWQSVDHTYLKKFVFNMKTGKCEIKTMLKDMEFEFPVIHQNFIGYKNQYAYLSYIEKDLKNCKVNPDDLILKGFVKYDLQAEKVVNKVDFGETKTAGEVFFQSRTYSEELQPNYQDEDDGYVMTVVHDSKTDTSSFVMWDSQKLNEEPVLVANLQQRVPHGFHTTFVPEEEMEK